MTAASLSAFPRTLQAQLTLPNGPNTFSCLLPSDEFEPTHSKPSVFL